MNELFSPEGLASQVPCETSCKEGMLHVVTHLQLVSQRHRNTPETCLATPSQHKLQLVSQHTCNLSRNAIAIRLQLVSQRHRNTSCNLSRNAIATHLQRVSQHHLNTPATCLATPSQHTSNLSRNAIATHLQLVSQHHRNTPTTCLATPSQHTCNLSRNAIATQVANKILPCNTSCRVRIYFLRRFQGFCETIGSCSPRLQRVIRLLQLAIRLSENKNVA